MKKIKVDWIKDKVITAEAQYQRMTENINKGIVNQQEIVSAMNVINIAHLISIKENRRELLDDVLK